MFIDGINHVTLKVRDLERSDRFYSDVLGLKRVGGRLGMRFYSSGRFAHELALLQDPDYALATDQGLLHLCFNTPDEDRLRALHRRCRTLGVPTTDGVDHTIMHSFYLRDPDGYVIEIGVDRSAEEWSGQPHAFARDRPLDLACLGPVSGKSHSSHESSTQRS